MELAVALNDLNISLEKSNAFGYLPTAAITTTTLADTYYPIAGTFTNPVLDNFVLDGDKIVYKGTETREFKVILSVSVSSDTGTCTTTIGVSKDGSVPSGLSAVRLLKLTTDIGSWICQGELTLETDDEVQLVVKSDKVGAELTFHTTQTNIFPPTHIIE